MGNVLVECFKAKKQHSKVYYLDTPWGPALFRPLSLREYKSAIALIAVFHPADINDLVVETALLYYEKGLDWLINHSPGTLVDQIADHIIKCSKFGSDSPLEKDIDDYRKNIGELDSFVTGFLMRAFPNLNRNEVVDCSYDELMRLVVIGEMILGPLPFGEAGKKQHRSSRTPRGLNALSKDELLDPSVADRPPTF